MKRTVLGISVFLLLVFVSGAWAKGEQDPNHVRETFALSGDAKLALAAEALGDDQLLNILEELKKSPSTADENVKKVLKKLR
ncbi:MAG: hypothetical protein V1798_00595 [Pseudomonadota bacterium]